MEIIRINLPDYYLPNYLKGTNRIPWEVIYLIPREYKTNIGMMFKTALVIAPSSSFTLTILAILRHANHKKNITSPITIREPWIDKLQNKEVLLTIPTYIKDEYLKYLYARNAKTCKNLFMAGDIGDFELVHNQVWTSVCAYCKKSPHLLLGDCEPGTKKCIQMFSI